MDGNYIGKKTLHLLAFQNLEQILSSIILKFIGNECHRISNIMIHQIFLLACDWSKRVTWANIPLLKLGNIRDYNPSNIFARARLV